jgi:DNA-binding winged helix-turn-helix (wHTH) protein/Tol biopolymer transport system component
MSESNVKSAKNIIYSFGFFTLDVLERRLWKGKDPVAVTPKAFDTLLVLLENKGRIVDKNVLLDRVWKDTFVEESTIAQNISTLRRVLGLSAEGKQFIETVPRRGYRFVADVKEVADDEEIVVIEQRLLTHIADKSDAESVNEGYNGSISSENGTRDRAIANSLIKTPRNYRIVRALILLLLTLSAVAVWLGFRYSMKSQGPFANSAFLQTQISKLTSEGNVDLVKVSPSGAYLAVVYQNGEDSSLQLRQIGNSTGIEIVPPKHQKYIGVTFSPDERFIFYVIYPTYTERKEDSYGILYKVPILGGQVQQVLSDIDSPIAISPDATQYAFVRNFLNEGRSAILIGNFENHEQRELASRVVAEYFATSGLAWSPNGKVIVGAANSGGDTMEIVGVEVNTGRQWPLTSEKWRWAGFPNWLADGSGIVISAFASASENLTDAVWIIPFPNGSPRKIASGTKGIFGLSSTADSKNLVVVESNIVSAFWTAPGKDPKDAQKVRQNLPEYDVDLPGINWTADNRIIYGSTLNGNVDIWMTNANGTDTKQITNNAAADSQPVATSDGQHLFFVSNRLGRKNLWMMNIDGSNERQLTNQDGVSSPSIARFGEHIYYSAPDDSDFYPHLYRILINGGEPTELTKHLTLLPQVSPDGKLIACYLATKNLDNQNMSKLRLTILTSDTAAIIKQWDIGIPSKFSPIVWSDDRTINYVVTEGGISSLWSQPIDADKPEILFSSQNEQIFRFAWSNDGQRIAYEKGQIFNDVVLIKSIEN